MGSGEKSPLKSQVQSAKKSGKNQNQQVGQTSQGVGGGSGAKKSEKEKAGSKMQAADENNALSAKAAEARGTQASQPRAQEGKDKVQKQIQKNKQIVSSLVDDLKAKQDGKSSPPMSSADPITSSAQLLLQTPVKKEEEAANRNQPASSSQQAASNPNGKNKIQSLSHPNNPEERDASAASGTQAKASAHGASSTEKSLNKRDKKFMRKTQ